MQVNEFVYIPGENEVEYIALLREALRRQRAITNKAIAKLKENKIQRWIPVTEALPEESGEVLIRTGPSKYCTHSVNYSAKHKQFNNYDSLAKDDGAYTAKVTHWMPIPDMEEELDDAE